MNYFINIGAALSQLLHSVFDGHSQISISSQVGYMSLNSKSRYWKYLESIIDFTFRPIDGADHCLKAYQKDPLENYKRDYGSKLSFALLAFTVTVVCIFISPILFLMGLLLWLVKRD